MTRAQSVSPADSRSSITCSNKYSTPAPGTIPRAGAAKIHRRSLLRMIGMASLSTLIVPNSIAAADDTVDDEEKGFCGDYETGDTSQFAFALVQGGTTKPQVVTNPTRSIDSKYACAYTLSGTQYRCESTPGYKGYTFGTEGADLYYGWSVLYPADFPVAPWQVCAQWHHPFGDGSLRYDGAPPPLAVYVAGTNENSDPTRWAIGNNGHSPSEGAWSIDLGQLDRETWYDVVVRQKFSVIPSNCLVEVWVNGAQIASRVPSAPLIYPTEQEAGPRGSFFKVGYYRDQSCAVPATVFLTTFEWDPVLLMRGPSIAFS